MRGPMGKPKNRVENPGKLLKRLMDYIFRDYKFHCIIVFILIFVGVIANVQGTMFTRDLIDKYTDNCKSTVDNLRNTLAYHLSECINVIRVD